MGRSIPRVQGFEREKNSCTEYSRSLPKSKGKWDFSLSLSLSLVSVDLNTQREMNGGPFFTTDWSRSCRKWHPIGRRKLWPRSTARHLAPDLWWCPNSQAADSARNGCRNRGNPALLSKWQWYQGSLDDVWGQIYKDFFSLVSIRSPLEQSYRNFKKASNALIKRLIWNINSADTYVVLEQCDRQIMLRHARLHGRKRTQVVDQINNRRRAAACSRSLRRRARPTSTTSLLARTSLPRTPAATRRRRRSGTCASAAARPAAAARPRAPTTPARSARPPRCTRAAAYTCVCQVDR
jgi:hypothetical protein